MTSETDYATYLRIDDLLDLQRPLTAGAHDEMLFIVVHQVYELWFKLVLHELDAAASALDDGDPAAAVAPLRRAVGVEELLIAQLGVLESMSPDGFMRFRDPLAPASGFQSTQFREIEALSGAGDVRHLDAVSRPAAQRQQLLERIEARTLYDALCDCHGRGRGRHAHRCRRRAPASAGCRHSPTSTAAIPRRHGRCSTWCASCSSTTTRWWPAGATTMRSWRPARSGAARHRRQSRGRLPQLDC